MEFDPDAHLILQTDAGEFRMDRYNAAFFTHLGDLAMYDHIFVQTDPDDDERFGTYIFRHSPVFEQISVYMVEHDFPLHLNAPEAADCDKDAFNAAIDKETACDTYESYPAEWDTA